MLGATPGAVLQIRDDTETMTPRPYLLEKLERYLEGSRDLGQRAGKVELHPLEVKTLLHYVHAMEDYMHALYGALDMFGEDHAG